MTFNIAGLADTDLATENSYCLRQHCHGHKKVWQPCYSDQ